MLWRVSRLLRSRSSPTVHACPASLRSPTGRPSGPGWLHEIKFDGYRVIARKDGDRVRLWARTTSDYSNTFTRIRDAVAALPVAIALSCSERLDASERSEQPAKAILSQTIRRVLSGASAKTAPRAPMGAHDKGLFRRVHAHLSNPTSDPITPAHRVPLSAPPGSRVSPRCRKSVTIRES